MLISIGALKRWDKMILIKTSWCGMMDCMDVGKPSMLNVSRIGPRAWYVPLSTDQAHNATRSSPSLSLSLSLCLNFRFDFPAERGGVKY